MKTGLDLIAEERQRQQDVEGYTAAQDDGHLCGEMACAASVYAEAAVCLAAGDEADTVRHDIFHSQCVSAWPWDESYLKLEGGPIRCLAKAGALIAAEIDRLQRLQ